MQKRKVKKISTFLFFLSNKKMREKTLKFDNIRVIKKKFHKSKQPIDLMSANIDQRVILDKFKHSDDGFKYFIDYKEDELLNRYALSCLKRVDTSNTLKMEEKTSIAWFKMRRCWINTMKFGTRF